jgi:hypothetical protein
MALFLLAFGAACLLSFVLGVRAQTLYVLNVQKERGRESTFTVGSQKFETYRADGSIQPFI